MKLKFTPQVENHKNFQKKSKKNFFDPIFSMTSAFFWQKMAKNCQIRGQFQNFVTNYPKMIL